MFTKTLKNIFLRKKSKETFLIVHMNVHKNKKMLETILKNPEHSITLKSTCERPEIQDVNVFNSINQLFELITNLEEGNTVLVNSLAIMLNENIISTGSYDNSIKIWKPKPKLYGIF